MKAILILIALVLMAMPAAAQRVDLAIDSSYAADGNTGWVQIQSHALYRLVVQAADSFNVSLTLRYLDLDSDTSTYRSYAVEPDSTNGTNNAGWWKGYVLRTAAADSIPGAERVMLAWVRKFNNGTSTPQLSAYLIKQ